jgi:hypothetical protein
MLFETIFYQNYTLIIELAFSVLVHKQHKFVALRVLLVFQREYLTQFMQYLGRM